MSYILAALIIAILLVICYEALHGYFFNIKKRGCNTCESFYVHPMYDDAEKASLIMDNVDKKIQKLINHLTFKYPDDERAYLLRKNYEKNNIYMRSPQII